MASKATAATKRLFLATLAIIGVITTITVINANPYRVITGVVSANDTERIECTFAIGNGAALLLRPGSVACDRMKALIGRQVDGWFEVVK
jgi:hypothetical protein